MSIASVLNIAAPSLSQAEHWVGNGAAMLVQRILVNQFQPSSVNSRFDSALQHFMDAYQQLGNQKSKFYDGAEALLGQLHQNSIKQGVITNKPSRFTEPLFFQFGISQYFDLVYSGDSFTEKKPHPMPLKRWVLVLVNA